MGDGAIAVKEKEEIKEGALDKLLKQAIEIAVKKGEGSSDFKNFVNENLIGKKVIIKGKEAKIVGADPGHRSLNPWKITGMVINYTCSGSEDIKWLHVNATIEEGKVTLKPSGISLKPEPTKEKVGEKKEEEKPQPKVEREPLKKKESTQTIYATPKKVWMPPEVERFLGTLSNEEKVVFNKLCEVLKEIPIETKDIPKWDGPRESLFYESLFLAIRDAKKEELKLDVKDKLAIFHLTAQIFLQGHTIGMEFAKAAVKKAREAGDTLANYYLYMLPEVVVEGKTYRSRCAKELIEEFRKEAGIELGVKKEAPPEVKPSVEAPPKVEKQPEVKPPTEAPKVEGKPVILPEEFTVIKTADGKIIDVISALSEINMAINRETDPKAREDLTKRYEDIKNVHIGMIDMAQKEGITTPEAFKERFSAYEILVTEATKKLYNELIAPKAEMKPPAPVEAPKVEEKVTKVDEVQKTIAEIEKWKGELKKLKGEASELEKKGREGRTSKENTRLEELNKKIKETNEKIEALHEKLGKTEMGVLQDAKAIYERQIDECEKLKDKLQEYKRGLLVSLTTLGLLKYKNVAVEELKSAIEKAEVSKDIKERLFAAINKAKPNKKGEINAGVVFKELNRIEKEVKNHIEIMEDKKTGVGPIYNPEEPNKLMANYVEGKKVGRINDLKERVKELQKAKTDKETDENGLPVMVKVSKLPKEVQGEFSGKEEVTAAEVNKVIRELNSAIKQQERAVEELCNYVRKHLEQAREDCAKRPVGDMRKEMLERAIKIAEKENRYEALFNKREVVGRPYDSYTNIEVEKIADGEVGNKVKEKYSNKTEISGNSVNWVIIEMQRKLREEVDNLKKEFY